MARIEGFRIKNFKALKDLTMGRLWNNWNAEPLTPLTAVIGKNGVGKSTIFDAFGFLSDCLKLGVEEACDAKGRGGYSRLISKGQGGAIEFEIYYRHAANARPLTYEVSISLDKTGRPYVSKERLRQRRKNQKTGWPFSFLVLNDGKGYAWKFQHDGIIEEETKDIANLFMKFEDEPVEESKEREKVELSDKRKLAIATLGSLKQHPRISDFREFIEDWYLSYFNPTSARSLPMSGPQKHLSATGDNLGNVVQYMEREHKRRFEAVLTAIAKKIPGIDKIQTQQTQDGRLLLSFNDKGFTDPFFAQQMSDGTLKAFSYLLLLEDSDPPAFLCIEEPENGLYHKLLEQLALEFRQHANNRRGGTQIFVTTHQPYFVNALTPNEVWILEKGVTGFSEIKRASSDPLICNLVEQGLPLGGLWYSDYLDS